LPASTIMRLVIRSSPAEFRHIIIPPAVDPAYEPVQDPGLTEKSGGRGLPSIAR
jgi:hypothetical protein